MADYTQLMNLEKKQQKPPVPSPVKPVKQNAEDQVVEQHISTSSSRLNNPSINQSIRQSINKANKVMDKPRGFYITDGLNQRIDEAVRYYQEKHNLKKVDRSIVVTALLDNETNWTEETLDLLIDKVISHLTNRLTNR